MSGERNKPAGNTQLWGGTGRVTPSAGAPPSHCPECGAPAAGRPICLKDGTLLGGPFSVGGRYLVEERLGAGGLALVFGARHQVLGKPVALKILRESAAADPAHADRFLREARRASQLRHDNIIDVSDFGQDETLGLLYLVMERLRGSTLAEELARSGPLPWQRVVPILIQLCRALAAAHAETVLHRDLNPRNVFLVRGSMQSDLVKLCDFGLSRLAGGEDRITAEGAFIGTPAYMAPEQIRGDAQQDFRVDLYALGTTAYELLLGTLPFEGASSVALITQKLTGQPKPLAEHGREIPPALEALVMRCLSSNPAERPESAAWLERALAELAAGAPQANAPVFENLVGKTVGSYHITRLLGQGGVGAVFLAEHPLIAAKVAIKVLRPEVMTIPGAEERFVQEARAVAKLANPHLPRYHDFGRLPGGNPFAVMEYLEGETLEARIQRGALTVAETAGLLSQVAEVLEEAHAAGIVHRDIKPENLFLLDGGDGKPFVKVLDFGIAKLTERPANARLTQAGLILGTPQFAPPEQLVGDEVGVTADVYALGATAFEMLTGRSAFEGEVAKIIQAKLTGDPPRLQGLPALVADSVAKMMAREPGVRPAGMAEVRRLLSAWAGAPPEVPERRSRRAYFFGGALLVSAVIGGAALLTFGARPEPGPAAPPAISERKPIVIQLPSPPPPREAAPPAAAPVEAARPRSKTRPPGPKTVKHDKSGAPMIVNPF